MKNIAVIIDCWEGRPHFASNIIADLQKLLDNLDTVILSSYCITKEEYFGKSRWYKNTKALIPKYFNQNWQFLENTFTDDDIRRETQELFFDLKLKGVDQLAIHTPTFLPLIDIKNVFLFGAAFDLCVQDRPMGAKSWMSYRKNIFYTSKGVIFSNGSAVDFTTLPEYAFYDEDIVEYCYHKNKVHWAKQCLEHRLGHLRGEN